MTNLVQHAAEVPYFIGVDLAGPRILAGGFSPSLQILGKTKFSPKPERGPARVLDRTARCVRDAVDECDLVWKQVRAVGLAVPGTVNAATGWVGSAPVLGWEQLPLRQELEQRLQRPVFPANDCHAAALAICTQELDTVPERLVAVFPDRLGFYGVLVRGRFAEAPSDLSVPALEFPAGPRPLPPRNPAKQLRKAIQAGNPQAETDVQVIAQQTGAFVAGLARTWRPDVIAFGGGAIEELGEWLLPAIRRELEGVIRSGEGGGPQLVVSQLGKDVGMVGAATWAAQQTSG